MQGSVQLLFAGIVQLVHVIIHHIADDHAGADSVHPDVILGVIQCHHAGCGIHCALGTGVQHVGGLAHQAVNGRNVDDAAAPARLHGGDNFARAAHAAEIVRFQQAEHILIFVFRCGTVAVDANGRNQNVKAAAVLYGSIHKGFGLVGFGQVYHIAAAAGADGLQFFFCGAHIFFVAAAEIDVRPLARKQQSNAFANAAGSGGDEHIFSCQHLVIIGDRAQVKRNISHISTSFFWPGAP